MDPGLIGLILLFGVAVAASVFLHSRDRSLLRASFISAILATGVLQIADVIYRGYPDKFLPIAFVLGGAVAFIVSLLIGWILRWRRRMRRPPGSAVSDS